MMLLYYVYRLKKQMQYWIKLVGINKSNLCAGIVDNKNVEPRIFIETLLNLVRFETFAGTPFLNFRNFQSTPTTCRDHLTDSIINTINGAFGFSRTILKSKGQGVFGHLHESHGLIDILFFNSVYSLRRARAVANLRIAKRVLAE